MGEKRKGKEMKMKAKAGEKRQMEGEFSSSFTSPNPSEIHEDLETDRTY